jgi:hypothetical protein
MPVEALFCPNCDYDLRGITSDRCPECGTRINRAVLRSEAASRIPWVHRGELGVCRAYWHTLVFATFDPRRLAKEVVHPLNLDSARRFRFWTFVLAILPTVIMSGLFALPHIGDAKIGMATSSVLPDGIRFPADVAQTVKYLLAWVVDSTVLPLVWFCLYMWLNSCSAVVTPDIEDGNLPAPQKYSATVLSHYYCAPLAWIALLPVLIIPAMVLAHLAPSTPYAVVPICVLCGFAITVASAVLYWANCLILLRCAARCSSDLVVGAAVMLPIAWAALAVGIVIGVPLLYAALATALLSVI